jgi:hypothetical protein
MDKAIEELREALTKLVAAARAEGVDDTKGQKIIDVADEIEAGLADLLAEYGIEIGDERVD